MFFYHSFILDITKKTEETQQVTQTNKCKSFNNRIHCYINACHLTIRHIVNRKRFRYYLGIIEFEYTCIKEINISNLK